MCSLCRSCKIPSHLKYSAERVWNQYCSGPFRCLFRFECVEWSECVHVSDSVYLQLCQEEAGLNPISLSVREEEPAPPADRL